MAEKFKLEDYVDVKTRVAEFYQKYPTGRIISTIIDHAREAGYMFVLMKTEVFRYHDEPLPASTGHAFEINASGPINKTSHVENCETSAVGRALALLNLGIGHSIASREEIEKVQRMTSESDPDTVKKIREIWTENGGTEEQLQAWVKKNNNDVSLDELKGDRQQAMLQVLEQKKLDREAKAKENLETVAGGDTSTEPKPAVEQPPATSEPAETGKP
jgi:hypothetical protein